MFRFNEVVSFVVRCDAREEVSEHWDKLSAGAAKERAVGSRIALASPGRSRACLMYRT